MGSKQFSFENTDERWSYLSLPTKSYGRAVIVQNHLPEIMESIGIPEGNYATRTASDRNDVEIYFKNAEDRTLFGLCRCKFPGLMSLTDPNAMVYSKSDWDILDNELGT